MYDTIRLPWPQFKTLIKVTELIDTRICCMRKYIFSSFQNVTRNKQHQSPNPNVWFSTLLNKAVTLSALLRNVPCLTHPLPWYIHDHTKMLSRIGATRRNLCVICIHTLYRIGAYYYFVEKESGVGKPWIDTTHWTCR